MANIGRSQEVGHGPLMIIYSNDRHICIDVQRGTNVGGSTGREKMSLISGQPIFCSAYGRHSIRT